jgi:hypothetical protein
MTQRLCTFCGAPTATGLTLPWAKVKRADWQVFYCPAHQPAAEEAQRAEMTRRGLR